MTKKKKFFNVDHRKTSSGGGPNCTGPGSIADYVSYVKSGGFVPLPVLEPERGIESALFAQYPGDNAITLVFLVIPFNTSKRKDLLLE